MTCFMRPRESFEKIKTSVAFQIQKNKPVVADDLIRQHIFCHYFKQVNATEHLLKKEENL